MIEIVITPLGLKAPGRFEARYDDRVILKSSRQPLLDAARVFLAQGIDPDTRISMRHEGSPHVALSSSIGAAAKLTAVGARMRPATAHAKKRQGGTRIAPGRK